MEITLVIDADTRRRQEFTFSDHATDADGYQVEGDMIEDVMFEDIYNLGAGGPDTDLIPTHVVRDRYEREHDVIPTLYVNTLAVRVELVTIIRGVLYVGVRTLARPA